jgi:hypothetical protein
MTDNRIHSPLGASSAYRWWACPGSIREAAKYENVSSVYAQEGTAAHSLGARCLTNESDAADYIGLYANDKEVTCIEGTPNSFEIDDEMAVAVQQYLDFCRSVIEPGDEWEVEQRFDLSAYHDGMCGTADFVCYKPESKKLIVADYKHGRGVPVEVEANPQLLYYAFGAASRYHNRPLDSVEIVVVQPRCGHPSGAVRRWTIDAVGLMEWLADLLDAARRTEAPDAPLVAGDHCKFCPAAPGCPALRQKVLDTATDDFTESGVPIMKKVEGIDSAELARRLAEVDTVEDWCRRVREYAHHEAEAGRYPPGFKLVPTRPRRVWKDEDQVKQFLTLNDVEQEDMLTEPKFRSPTQMEEVLRDKYGYRGRGKTAKAFLKDLHEPRSSGTVLAPLADARAPVKSEAEEDFA